MIFTPAAFSACAGSVVATSSSTLSLTGSSRKLTVTATGSPSDAVVCLTRNTRDVAQIGAPFGINGLTQQRLPATVTDGLQFTVTITGIPTFNAGTDVITFRRTTCAGTSIAGAAPVVSGGGTFLDVVFLPEEVLCTACVRACVRAWVGVV